MICESCGGERPGRDCTSPISEKIIAHLRQELTALNARLTFTAAALSLRVEALEQSELAGVLPPEPMMQATDPLPIGAYRRTASGHVYEMGVFHNCNERDCPARGPALVQDLDADKRG